MRKQMLVVPALVLLLAASAVGVSGQEGTGPADLVTEEVEPGVERVIRDGAGHDLDEKHPTYRYDMDGIVVTPDGTVWLASTFSRSDNEANPPGPLVWALGRPGTATIQVPARGASPISFHELAGGTLLLMAWGAPFATSDGGADWTLLEEPGPAAGDCSTRGRGVTCVDASGEETTYLAGTQINQVVTAPDGTVWAVGGYRGDNGGLYRISRD